MLTAYFIQHFSIGRFFSGYKDDLIEIKYEMTQFFVAAGNLAADGIVRFNFVSPLYQFIFYLIKFLGTFCSLAVKGDLPGKFFIV